MAHYRQSPNYIAKKSLWNAYDHWLLTILYIILIPAVLIFLNLRYPEIFTWYVFAGLYMLLPIALIGLQKKKSAWKISIFIIFIILIPGVVVALCLLLPPIAELLDEYVFTNGWAAFGTWCLGLLIYHIGSIINLSHDYIEFHDNFVIARTGVFLKDAKKMVFPEITSVTTHKNILGYGEVVIDVVGPWDIKFEGIARPDDLRDYLVYHMLNNAAVENISNNPYIAAADGILSNDPQIRPTEEIFQSTSIKL